MPNSSTYIIGYNHTVIRAVDGSIVADYDSPVVSRESDIVKSDPLGRRKPSGWLPPLNYTFTKYRRESNYGSFGYYNDYDGGTVMSTGPANLMGEGDRYERSVSATADMENRAIIKALSKLRDQRFNAGVALGEAAKTADLVGTTAMRLAKAYRHLKHLEFGKARRALGMTWRDTPANWLELQYGWKPLLHDVHGAVMRTMGRAQTGLPVLTVKGVSGEQRKFDDDLNDHPLARTRCIGKSDGSVFVRLDYEMDDQTLHAFSSLGLTNPAAIAWELVPYSFVVDWMLPIGDWLSVIDASLGLKFKGGSASYRERFSCVVKHRPYTEPGFYYRPIGRYATDGKYSVLTLSRRTYAISPIPQFPRFKNPLSLGHMANGLSLLASAFGVSSGSHRRLR